MGIKVNGLIVLMVVSGLSIQAANWPHYMGPTRDHVSAETGLVQDWQANKPKVLWRAEIGLGYSGVAVVGDRAYTMGHDGKQHETVWCFDVKTGTVVWKHRYAADLMAKYHKGGPNATPTVAEGVVYTVSKDGQLQALDAATGSVKWAKKLVDVFKTESPTWGFASSVILHDGKLWLYANGPAALDPASGKVLWTDPAPGKSGYSTPRIFTRGGKTFIAGMTGTHLRIHDLATKKEVATFEFKVQYDVNAVTPMVLEAGNTVIIGNGYKNGRTIRLSFNGSSLKEVWFNRDLKLMMNNPVIVDGYIYGVDGNNNKAKRTRLVCASLKTGEIQWDHLGLGCGSVVHANGTNYILSETGELLVAPASPKGFLPRGRMKVFNRGVCWTAPALAHGMLFARNDAGDLACINLKK